MEHTNMELQVYLKWTLHSIDLLYTAIQCMVTFVVQWDAHSPEVSMNIWTAKVCIPWFATLSSKFPAEHLSLLLEWFTPFLSPLFLLSLSLSVQYFGQRLLFKRKYCRVVPIHSHLYWNLKRQASWSDIEFKIVIIFRWRSREDSLFQAFYYLNAWNRLQRRKKMDLWKQMLSKWSFTFFCGIFWFKPVPFHEYSLCSVCILHSVWHFTPGLLSAVRSLRFTLTGFPPMQYLLFYLLRY